MATEMGFLREESFSVDNERTEALFSVNGDELMLS